MLKLIKKSTARIYLLIAEAGIDNADTEYANPDATVDRSKPRSVRQRSLCSDRLRCTHASPEIALVGYKDEATGQYKLLKDSVYFRRSRSCRRNTQEGHVRLIVPPYMRGEYKWSIRRTCPL
jgi:hypothetical protein